MNQSDPLELVEAGSLSRPGPIGRIVRLSFGVLCSYGLFELISQSPHIVMYPVSSFPDLVILILVALSITNYVVNIGFSQSWGRRPAIAVLSAIVFLAAFSWMSSGQIDHPILGAGLLVWLIYFYSHLGISFLLAAILATPGCEMRAIPELIGRLLRRPSAEHHCPVSFLTRIDQWERQRLQSL